MKLLGFIAAGSALALSLCLTACGSKPRTPAESATETTASQTTQAATETETATDTQASTEAETTAETEAPTETETTAETEAPTETATESQPSVGYKEMTAYDAQNPDSYVRYPMQEGGKDADAVNALIKARVDEMLASIHDEDLDVPDMEWICNIYVGNYEITRDDEKYLSILWTGDWYVSYAAHPNNFAQSIIIDKESLKEVKFSDLYTVDEALVQKVQAQVDAKLQGTLAEKFDVSTDEVSEITSSVSLDDLLQSGTEFGWGRPVCLTENGIILSVSVPHYIGDHCEIEIATDALS